MTGKSDIGGMWNFPSHLSQPSRRKMYDFIPISPGEQTAYFTPKNCDFGAKQEEKKENSQPHRTSHPLPAVLPPVGRFVASKWGSGVRIPPSSFGSVSGSFSVRRKRSRRKGRRRGHPRPGHFCPQCGQLRRSTSGVVEGNFWRAVGSKTEMIPQLREKLRGRSKISRRKMK